MFIFSSANFQQAVKRIQYFKQYSDYQNKTTTTNKANNTAELKSPKEPNLLEERKRHTRIFKY